MTPAAVLTLAQAPPDLTSAGAAMLGAAGPLGVVIYLVKVFLDYQRQEGQVNRDAIKSIGERVEAIASRFEQGQHQIVNEFRQEHRQTMNQIVGITRESVGAMSTMGERVGDLGQGVSELKGEVRHLGETVTALSDTVGHLGERVDRVDGAGPPNKPKPGGG